MGKKNKETPRYPHAHAFVPVGKFGTPASLHKLVKWRIGCLDSKISTCLVCHVFYQQVFATKLA